MAQGRYTRVFLLPKHLHCEGFPFEIEAGALLVDSKMNSVLAQLKMASHADANVKAVEVTLQPVDVKGNPLGETVCHQYLDLDVRRGESFGQKTPIQFPDNNARSFSIVEIEVVYENGCVDLCNGEWVPLPEQEALGSSVPDEELIKQYEIDFGKGCVFRLEEMGDLWRCICGATNREDEGVCHSCGKKLVDLRAIDPDAVEKHKTTRLEAERAAAELAAELERKRKKNTLVTAIIAVAVVVAVSFIAPTASKYIDAMSFMKAGDYRRASKTFEELGNFLDSHEKVIECDYDYAITLMDDEMYMNAVLAFEELGDYKDSVAKAKECRYLRALSLMESGIYSDAEEAFEELGDYKDSHTKAEECRASQK